MSRRGEELLMELGLSAYESRCYAALLRGFPANPYQLSKRAAIPTSKIYEVVARLEERGLVTKLAGDAGCVPKDPRIAMSEWQRRYTASLAEAAEALAAEMRGPKAYVVWNVDSSRSVGEQGGRLLAGARSHASIAAPAEVIDLWAEEVEAARERGVFFRLISYGRPRRTAQVLPDKVFPGRIDSPPRPTRETRGRPDAGGVLVVDHRAVLFVSPTGMPGEWRGAWTDNPAIAGVAEEYVDDKLFIERMREGRERLWGGSDY